MSHKQLESSWLWWGTFPSQSCWSPVVWRTYSVLWFTETLFCSLLLSGHIPLFALTKYPTESHWSMWSFVAWQFCHSVPLSLFFPLYMPGCLKYGPLNSEHLFSSLNPSETFVCWSCKVKKSSSLSLPSSVHLYYSPLYKYKTKRDRTHLKIKSHTSVISRFLAYANLENVISS